MEMNTIKGKATRELQDIVETLIAELFALRFQKTLGKLESTHRISELRKDIARCKTELSERKNKGEIIIPLNNNHKFAWSDDSKTPKSKSVKAKKINKLAINTKITEKKAATKPEIKQEEKA